MSAARSSRASVSRLHPVPRAWTARLHCASLDARRPRRRLPAVTRPRPVTRHLRVGERHAAVADHRRRRLDVKSLLQQPRSLLQFYTQRDSDGIINGKNHSQAQADCCHYRVPVHLILHAPWTLQRIKLQSNKLADRAYATVLRPSVCRLSVCCL